MVRSLFRVSLVCLLSLLAVEWVIELLIARYQTEWEKRTTPTYSWALYNSFGEPIGSKRGLLKLVLRPYITYGNLPNQRTPFFSIDEQGYRGGGSIPSNGSAPHSVLVGGSAAFGSGLGGDDETFAAHLARAVGGQIVNAAVIGHASGQELAYVATELGDLKPSYVIAFDGWNDFMEGSWEGRIVQTGDVGFLQIEKQLVRLTDLTTGGLAGRIAHAVPQVVFPQLALGLEAGWRRITGSPPETLTAARGQHLAHYVENHKRLATISAAFGARLVVVLQPDLRALLLERDSDSLDQASRETGTAYAEFVSEARTSLQQQGISHLVIGATMPLAKEHFMDNVHLTSEGYRIVAAALARYLGEGSSSSAADSSQ